MALLLLNLPKGLFLPERIKLKVAVIGLGKAGLPLAAVMAEAGLNVTGIDLDAERVDLINRKQNPIPEEEGLTEILKRQVGNNFKATTDYSDAKECEAYLMIVPLFIDDEKRPDFSILRSATRRIAGIIDDGNLVVLETTLPPGSTNRVIKPILDASGKNYNLAYSPERIMTGRSISRYMDFPKVVGGIDRESGKKAFDLYARFNKKVDLVSNAETAEMIKVAEGIYRDVNIALANEILKVCNSKGIDYAEVQEKTRHQFCNLHFPGNVGGHCIPVYPWFLINYFDVPLIETARRINDEMIFYYADAIKEMTKGGKILVVGVSYREGVKETAYTRSIPFIRLLEKRGYDVFCFDPLYSQKELSDLGLKYLDLDCADKIDAIIVMNDYPDLHFSNKNVLFIKSKR